MSNPIVLQANAVYRDYVVDGVASSGANEPIKPDIRALWALLGPALDSATGLGGGQVGYLTKADMDADLLHDAGTIAQVFSDSTPANNGTYLKSGASGSGSWDQISTLTLAGLQAALTAEVARATAAEAPLAPLNSPAFTGNPTAPNRSSGDNSSKLANTRYVDAAAGGVAADLATEVSRATTRETSILGVASVMPPLIAGEIATAIEVNASNQIVSARTRDGGNFTLSDSGLMRAQNVGERRLLSSPTAPLIDGEIPIDVEVDSAGQIARALTKTGREYVAEPGGLDYNLKAAAGGVFTPAASFVAGSGLSSGGFCLPTPNGRPICYILPVMGQSNALGQNPTGLAVIGDPALYPDDVFMLGSQPRVTDQFPLKYMGPFDALTPLVEVQNGTSTGETPCSGWANHFVAKMFSIFGVNPKVISFVSAQGATRYYQLRRGSGAYQGYISALGDAVRLARARGWVPIVPMLNWYQGETDMEQAAGVVPSASAYAAYMTQLQRDVMADTQAITGQREPVLLLITSQNHIAPTASGFDAFNQPFHQALDLLRAHPYIRIAGPNYHLAVNTTDYIHLTSIAHNRDGQKLARALLAEVAHVGWRDIHVVRHKWTSSTAVALTFHNPVEGANLVLDTSGTWVATSGLPSGNYYGFRFDDGSGSPPTISSHAISGNVLTLTLSGAPTGPNRRLAYATQRNTGETYNDGNVLGARGCLRSSAGDVSLYDAATNYDWATQFVRDL